jgi:hypothetical protein
VAKATESYRSLLSYNALLNLLGEFASTQAQAAKQDAEE